MINREAKILLQWYDASARALPWRVRWQERAQGKTPDPYAVWLSEIMAQQTQIVTVIPYFERFLQRWPTVDALAVAELDSVLQAWAGLGYYARARNLHKAAQQLAKDGFPTDANGWLALPGVGAYASAAIAAIVYDESVAVVDGNVERVMARYFAIETPLPEAKPAIRKAAEKLTPENRAGDYAQAVMDLGASICTPRNPQCLLCPLQENCLARQQGIQANLPKKKPKQVKPKRYGFAYLLRNASDEIFLIRRPDTGLLAKMMALPSSEWLAEYPALGDGAPLCLATVQAGKAMGEIRHSFTHFDLTLRVIDLGKTEKAGTLCQGTFVPSTKIWQQSLPTLMRKALKLVEI